MTVLEKGNITIHTENIFPIIKKSLYTDHEIFLRELISNAVDAISKKGTVTISSENKSFNSDEIESLEELAPGHYVYVTVHDSGSGINAQVLKHVFDPFFTTKPLQ